MVDLFETVQRIIDVLFVISLDEVAVCVVLEAFRAREDDLVEVVDDGVFGISEGVEEVLGFVFFSELS